MNLILLQAGQMHLRAVAGKYCLSITELRKKRKLGRHAKARQEIWFRLVITERFSCPRAAKMTGGHHHTSVLYGVRKYANKLLGTSMKAGLNEIRSAYGAYLNMLDKEEAA